MLRAGHHESWFFKPFNRGFDALTRGFVWCVDKTVAHRVAGVLIFLCVAGATVVMFLRAPTSFVPPEDLGYVFGALQLSDGATLQRTEKTGAEFQHLFADNPNIEHIFVIRGFDLIGGGNKTNAGTAFITLRPWDDRPQTAAELARDISRQGTVFRDGIVIAFSPPPIRGLGTAGGFEVYVQSRGDPDPKKLAQVVDSFTAALAKDPVLTGVRTFFRPTVPQLYADVNREQAVALGVSITDIFITLQSTLGAYYVNDFNLSGRTFRVQLQSDAPFRDDPRDLGNVYVRSTAGDMVPLKALLTLRNITGAEQLERYNGFISAKVLGAGRAGFSSGQAIKAVEATAARVLPSGYSIAWTGQAFQEKRVASSSLFAFGFAIIMVYLILAALYERWGVPVPSFAPLIRRDYQLTASTSYELDFWGRLRRSFESSRAQLLATEYARDVVELTLASTVAQTYFMLRSLDAQYAVLQASITSRSESLKITQQRERAGLAGALDVNQAAESLYDATVQARELDRQRAVALHQLQGLTGQLDLQIERENQPGLSLPLPAMPPAGLPSGLLERRPDVAVAEAALKSANAQIGVAQAGQLPTFSLTAAYGGDSLSLSNILSAPARLWSIGGGMTFPVLDWGRYQSRTDQAVARQQQAVATYQKAVQGAFRDVADALSNLQQTQNSEGDLFERTKSARERLRLAQLRYGAGYSPYLEVLDAERTANDADLALVRNRQAVLVYSVDLIRAIGGGWSQSTGFSDRSPDRTPWVQPALLAPQAPPASAPAALG